MAFLKEDDLIALSYHTLTPFSIFFPAVHVCKKEHWDFLAKYINTEGPCYPQQHYMVNLDKRIQEMLLEYEQDYDTGMDIHEMTEFLFSYTSGYPFLVSRI